MFRQLLYNFVYLPFCVSVNVLFHLSTDVLLFYLSHYVLIFLLSDFPSSLSPHLLLCLMTR